MALVLADRVKETTTSTGTTAITLAGAPTGYQTFSAAIGNANTTYYTIADQSGANWEVGIGTYTTSGNTLSRDTVLASSNSGSLVTFTSGTKDVFVTYPAERALYSGGTLGTPTSGTLTNCTFPTLNQNTTGNAATSTTTSGLTSATTTVSVSAATAPTVGQVLTATNGTTATWQTPISASANNTFTGKQSFTGTSSVLAAIFTNAAEVATVSATAATGTIAFYTATQSVLYYTANATGNWTLNLTHSSGTTLNTVMSIGQCVTVTHLVTQGATAYYNNVVQVDGTTTGVTTKWQGGTAPTSGDASAVDVYTYAIIKTANATFTVLAAVSKFA